MSPVTITPQNARTGPVLQIAGDLDYGSAHQLRQAVEQLRLGPDQVLVLDLSRLEFCDSSGITALIAARNHAVAARADIALAAVPVNTARILGIVGLDQVLTLYPDVQTATSRPGADR